MWFLRRPGLFPASPFRLLGANTRNAAGGVSASGDAVLDAESFLSDPKVALLVQSLVGKNGPNAAASRVWLPERQRRALESRHAAYTEAENGIAQLRDMARDAPLLRDTANAELEQLCQHRRDLASQMLQLILRAKLIGDCPEQAAKSEKNAAEARDVADEEAEAGRDGEGSGGGDEDEAELEVTAGVGGDEAALFAGNLADMYARYAGRRGWTWRVVEIERTGDGGAARRIVARVAGPGSFAELEHESGVHRVQRVPETEIRGRVHTSAASVVVMRPSRLGQQSRSAVPPLDMREVRVECFAASGPGGQNVNKSASAVRVTHLPTGLTATNQDERFQRYNRERALAVLAQRVAEARSRAVTAARSSQRRALGGLGDRSERVRTYHYKDQRVTDHRTGRTLPLDAVLRGERLGELISDLAALHARERIASLLAALQQQPSSSLPQQNKN